MSAIDLHDKINPRVAIAPAAAYTTNTPIVSSIIDLAGFESLEFVIATGAIAGGATFAVTLSEGNDPALADGARRDDEFDHRNLGARRLRLGQRQFVPENRLFGRDEIRPHDDHADQQHERLYFGPGRSRRRASRPDAKSPGLRRRLKDTNPKPVRVFCGARASSVKAAARLDTSRRRPSTTPWPRCLGVASASIKVEANKPVSESRASG
jgi:hypothetical protein